MANGDGAGASAGGHGTESSLGPQKVSNKYRLNVHSSIRPACCGCVCNDNGKLQARPHNHSAPASLSTRSHSLALPRSCFLPEKKRVRVPFKLFSRFGGATGVG